MNSTDSFYQNVKDEVTNYLLEHKQEEFRTIEHRASEFMGSLFGANRYSKVSQQIADVGVLVFGALDVLGKDSKGLPTNQRLTEEIIRAALNIYKDARITPETIIRSLQSSYTEFNQITGESPADFMSIVSSTYQSAKQSHKIEAPNENPADFLIRTVLRQRIDKNVLEIEEVFLNTSCSVWEGKILSGDITEYSVPLIVKLGVLGTPFIFSVNEKIAQAKFFENAANIGELTGLPVIKILQKGKWTFPNTYEYEALPDGEIRNKVTQGLSEYLKILEEYHRQHIEDFGSSFYEEEIEMLGVDGCLFGHRIGEEHYIILNKEITGWNKGGHSIDTNSCCTPLDFLHKIKILDLDNYIDFKSLDRLWLNSAVNEHFIKKTGYLINQLNSGTEKHDGCISYFEGEGEKLKRLSQISDRFMNHESRKGLAEFEQMLQKISSEQHNASS